jgi:hypothetical protein
MTERPERPNEVLGALPHRRPNRRSDKRATRAVQDPPPAEKPASTRPSAPTSMAPASLPSPPRGTELIGTMVQAAGELAEIGMSVTARAVREALARLPRP